MTTIAMTSEIGSFARFMTEPVTVIVCSAISCMMPVMTVGEIVSLHCALGSVVTR